MKKKDTLLYCIIFPSSSLWMLLWYITCRETIGDAVAICIALALMSLKALCFLEYHQSLEREC